MPDICDFFISYNKADAQWAEWIAWQLEEAGFRTILQAWDFRPGGNFVLAMDAASKAANRTIAVFSPDYLTSLYTQPEWAEAFARDPTGRDAKVVPVRVRECNLEGLLKPIIYVDLVGLDEPSATKELLEGVRQGRAKPATAPRFPAATHHTTPSPGFPTTVEASLDQPAKKYDFEPGMKVMHPEYGLGELVVVDDAYQMPRGTVRFAKNVVKTFVLGRSPLTPVGTLKRPSDSGWLPSPLPTPEPKFKPGERVIHPEYGVGRVLAVSGSGAAEKARVAFATAGEKTFLTAKAPLRRAQ